MNKFVFHGVIALVAILLSFNQGRLLADPGVNCIAGCMITYTCSFQDSTGACVTNWTQIKVCTNCCYGGANGGMCNQIGNLVTCTVNPKVDVAADQDDDSDGCGYCYNCDYSVIPGCQDNLAYDGDYPLSCPTGTCGGGGPE